MLRPKKLIPSLAAAVLALTGCGGTTDGGSGGTGGSAGTIPDDLAASLRGWCMNYVDCGFDYYNGVEQCVDSVREFYGQYITNLDDPACEAALMSYLDCGAALSCAELDELSNSCDDEFRAALEACTTAQP